MRTATVASTTLVAASDLLALVVGTAASLIAALRSVAYNVIYITKTHMLKHFFVFVERIALTSEPSGLWFS